MKALKIIRRLRAAICLIVLAIVSIVATMACIFGHVYADPARQRRWRNQWVRRWARAVASLAKMRVQVAGRPPTAPFLLVTNHVSYMDIAVLAAQLDCVFVAKGEVARWPLFGWASRSVGTIFVVRDRKRGLPTVMDSMRRSLVARSNVVFFPEGTTSDGTSVGLFKPSLLELAAEEKLPVHYASLSYRMDDASIDPGLRVCWWGEMPFLPHLFKLFQVSGFTAELVFGANPIHGSDRKALAADLRKAVERNLTNKL